MSAATSDRIIAAKTMAMEARGETLAGQQGVAHCLVNRVRDGRWGRTLTSVCLWNAVETGVGRVFQFSGWRSNDPNFTYACGLRDDDPVIAHMLLILEQAENAPDPTDNALFYYSERIAAPPWALTMHACGKFGTQIFLSDRPMGPGTGALVA